MDFLFRLVFLYSFVCLFSLDGNGNVFYKDKIAVAVSFFISEIVTE